MRVAQKYSHLNGEEYLLVHKKPLYKEILAAIDSIDASRHKTKVSEEQRRQGEMVYSPGALNKAFATYFEARHWKSQIRKFYVAPKPDHDLVKKLEEMPFEDQKPFLTGQNLPLYYSYNETDFVKQRVAVEVQLGKYFAVTYDLFVKHLNFYNANLIDVGVEIVPTMAMRASMSSGPPAFEKEVHNVLRHGRTTPPVPIVILGIEP